VLGILSSDNSDSSIFDVLTTTSLLPIAAPGYWAHAGVTRNLSITCLRPAAIGEKLTIKSEVVQAGRRMCTLKAEMRRERDGQVVAVGEHGKVAVGEDYSSKL